MGGSKARNRPERCLVSQQGALIEIAGRPVSSKGLLVPERGKDSGACLHCQEARTETSQAPLPQCAAHTCRNFTMFSLGLASFFSVGAWLNSSAGSTLSHLLYFPTNIATVTSESHFLAHRA